MMFRVVWSIADVEVELFGEADSAALPAVDDTGKATAMASVGKVVDGPVPLYIVNGNSRLCLTRDFGAIVKPGMLYSIDLISAIKSVKC